jgi:hypothetical protein
VIWNRHPYSLYLAQESTYFRLGHISDEIKPDDIAQVHLPYSSEKRVTVQLKGGYDKTSPFLIDECSDICLKVSRLTDLSRVKHLMTRKAAEFDVTLPPKQEIGLWLETDWNQENIVVKSVKKGRWAAATEIRKGDVLLAVNDEVVSGKEFKEVMANLKDLLAAAGALLRFRTLEEQLRLLRLRALGQNLVDDAREGAEQGQGVDGDKVSDACYENPRMWYLDLSVSLPILQDHPEYLNVQLKPVGPSIYVILTRLDTACRPPYKVFNKTKHFMIHFRQLACESHPWTSLGPHESCVYTWEEPMKPHR